MPLHTQILLLDPLSSDPGSPVDGEIWHNSTSNRVKARLNATTQILCHKSELDAHTGDTSNPHSTTLEQARTANNQISGDIDANSNTIINLKNPTNDGDAANKGWTNDRIAASFRGLDWQDSVLDKDLSTPPGSPSTGDRYIIASGGTGDWSGKDDQIAEWDSSAWVFFVPNEGFATLVEDEDVVYLYITSWGQFGSAIDHGSLLGLTDIADHPGYLDLGGTRAMTGSLDMGTNAITNVGNVAGVDVSDHSARHDPGGADELTTAAGTQGIGGGNSAGAANSFAKSGHDHAIRETGGPTDLTVGAIADTQYLTRSGTTIVGAAAPGAGYLVHKAGVVASGSFSGNPKTASVTFTGAFADTNYSVVVICEATANSWVPTVQSKTTAGFTINLNSNDITGLTAANWIAVKNGEST